MGATKKITNFFGIGEALFGQNFWLLLKILLKNFVPAFDRGNNFAVQTFTTRMKHDSGSVSLQKE